MVLAAYSPEGGGNKIKGGIREAEQHKSTGGFAQPSVSFPPFPFPPPPR